jgi:hypothetical protein
VRGDARCRSIFTSTGVDEHFDRATNAPEQGNLMNASGKNDLVFVHAVMATAARHSIGPIIVVHVMNEFEFPEISALNFVSVLLIGRSPIFWFPRPFLVRRRTLVPLPSGLSSVPMLPGLR